MPYLPFSHAGEAIADRVLTAVANTPASGAVFPTLPTEDQPLPFVVYRKVNGGGGVNLSGGSNLQQYLYRVDVYAETEAGAECIISALNHETTGLAGWSDRANGVQGVFPADDQDSDADSEGYRIPGQSFSIWFNRG